MDKVSTELIAVVTAAFGAGGIITTGVQWLLGKKKSDAEAHKIHIEGDVEAGRLAIEVANTYKTMNETLRKRQGELEQELQVARSALDEASETASEIRTEMAASEKVKNKLVHALKAIEPNHPLLIEIGEAG